MRILMIVMLSLSIGLGLTLFPVKGLWLFGAALLVLGIVFLVFLRRKEPRLMLIFLAAGVGILWGAGYQARIADPALQYAGSTMELTGEAISYSVPTQYGVQVDAELKLEQGTAKATLWISEEHNIKPGDWIVGSFRLKDSHASDSYYSYSEGIFLLGYSTGEVMVLPQVRIPAKYWPKAVAHKLETALEKSFDEDICGYAMALTTGNRSLLSALSKANLKASGIYHALALSGMHMAVLVSLVSFMVLKRKRRKALLGIPVCLVFTVVTGCSPSVVRAAVMQCLCLSAYLFRREKDTPTSLSLALGLLMLENPWCILNWGLQLSFLSVIGIELFGERFTAFFLGKKEGKYRLTQTLKRLAASSLSVTFSAMLMTSPLMALYFGFISLISPVTNILTGNVISICFEGSLLTALLGLFCPPAARGLGWCVGWGFRYVELVAAWMARVPFGQLYTDSVYGLCVVVMLYVGFGTVWKSKRKIIPLSCAGTVFAVSMLLIMLEGLAPSVTALDVGQGQCVLLRNRGSTMMVDCGGNNGNPGDTAAEYLNAVGETSLDLLVLTHFDDDHINGVSELMARVPVKGLAVPEAAGEERDEVIRLAMEMAVPVYVIRQDTTVSFGGDPVTLYAPVGDHSDNESGLSVLADLQNFEVLITGDMSETTEAILLTSKEIPQVDVLLAGHHGAKTSTSERLLRETAPGYVIISVGENRYGHPTEEVLQRIEHQGSILRRTDQDGNVTIKGE